MECSNSRPSVIKRRCDVEDKTSNVIIKEEEIISSVIVKNGYYNDGNGGVETTKNNPGPELQNNVQFDDDSEEEEFYMSPVQTHLNISKAKAAISKLFNDSPDDWRRNNEDGDFRPTVSNEFSHPEHIMNLANSPNVLNSSIYPVHLLPRVAQEESTEMIHMNFVEAPYYHFEHPMLLHDPIKAGIPSINPNNALRQNIRVDTSDDSGQSEIGKWCQSDRNSNTAKSRKFRYAKKEQVFDDHFVYEKSGEDHSHPFVCFVEGCGKTFSKSVHLTAHIRVHNGERPFRCEWSHCGKSFTRQCELKRHEWVHTKPGRFYCQACGKKFSRADHLKMHKTNCKVLAC